MAGAGDISVKDSKEFFNIFAAEFNRPELHDRVLVLDVFEDDFLDELSSKTNRIESIDPHDQKAKSDSQSTVGKSGNDEPMTSSSDSQNIETNSEETSSETPANNTNASVKEGDPPERERAGPDSEIPSGVKMTKVKVGLHVSPLEGQGQIVIQHKLFVHLWLAVHSNFFHTLFLSGLKEVHIRVTKSEAQAHLHLIEAMYKPDMLNCLTVGEVCSVLFLANKYEAMFVFRKCKYVLKSKVDSIEVCEKLFVQLIEGKHDMIESLEDLRETMEDFLVKKFSPLDTSWKTRNFQDLSQGLLRLLLSSSDLVVSCEDVVFHALMNWITLYTELRMLNKNKMNSLARGQMYSKISSLLSVVRFEKLTTSYLLSVVQHHPIAKVLENFSDHYLKGIKYSALPMQVKEALVDRPEERAATKADIVQFQWTMPEKHIVNAVTQLQSRPFWSCGFRMMLCLHRRFHNDDYYYVKIFLKILNLREDGFVSFDWKVRHQGEYVVSQSVSDRGCVFTAKTPTHGRKGGFVWKGTDTCVLDLIVKPRLL